MNQTNNRIREEWEKKFDWEFMEWPPKPSKVKSFIAELLKSQKDSLVEKIKDINVHEYNTREEMIEYIISLIKEDK